MASQYVQKQSQYDALARQRTHPSRKYYDYHAETSQSLEGPRRREAQMPRRAAQYVPLENASRRMPVDASALRGYTPSRAVVPRALPVQPSPASLRREGRMHGAGHSHSRSFDYYNTAEAHATPGSGPIFPSSIQAIRQTSTAHYSKSQYRQPVESPLAYRPAQPQASQPLRKPRVALECTVCGPGAVGPWQRGPIGPYTLCNSCAQISWQEDETGLPLDQHEALSLLDNMRLTRLASVTRNISSRADEDLAHRLQQGLPETTYAKAEAYYTRQAHTKTQLALNADTASQASRNVAKIVVQPPSEEQTTLSQKRRRDVIDDDNQIEAERRPLKTTSRASVVGHDASHGQNGVKQPLVTVPNDTTGLSPQSIAVAALIEQHLHNAAPSRSALTPSKVNLSSAGNREPLTERGSVKSSIPNGNSGDSKTCPSDPTMRSTSEAAVKHASSQFARPFPFRQGQIVKEQSDSRIIDRRRARNEELRRKYMKKRMDQQRAQEAKAAKREAEQNGQAASDLADAEKPQAGTPDSGTSQASATSLSNISSPPASLRNLLNDST